MLKTITINTDTHVVVPVELLKKARLCIEDYIEGAPSDGTDEKCMDDISAILATKQPEQAQLSDAEFHRGAKAVFDYMLCRAANNYHGNPEIQKQCDIENKAVTEWIEEALEDVSPESLMEWKSIALLCREISALKAQQSDPRPVPTIILGKGDKLVADIFQEDEDGILRMAGVGIFDPEPGNVYGIGVKDTRIDGMQISPDRNPLALIWSDKAESLQVIIDELQEAIGRLTGQQPAPRQIPPINQELDEFISGLVAKELAKRGSRKIETAPLPEPANVEQAQQDGTVINYGTMVSDEFLACFDSAFSFLANGHSIGQCFDMMKFAKAELIKSMKNKPAPRPVPTCDWQEDADGIWETSCGEAWVCTEGTPAENNMKFCHSCGKHLKEHRYAEPDGGAV